MDNLAEKGKLTCKEFGKAKIYFPNQDSVPKLTKEEQEGMRRESAALSALVKAESEAVNDLKQKIQGLKSSLTVKELQASHRLQLYNFSSCSLKALLLKNRCTFLFKLQLDICLYGPFYVR